MKNCNRTRRTSSAWLADSPICNSKPPSSSSGVDSPSYEMWDDEHQSIMMLRGFHIINMPDEDDRFQEDIDHNVPGFEDPSEMNSEPLDLSMKKKNLLPAATEPSFINNLVRWTGTPVTDDRNIPPECPTVMTAWPRVLYDEINRPSNETTFADLDSSITHQSETIQSNYNQESCLSETNQLTYHQESIPHETNQSNYNQESSPSETNQLTYYQESIPHETNQSNYNQESSPPETNQSHYNQESSPSGDVNGADIGLESLMETESQHPCLVNRIQELEMATCLPEMVTCLPMVKQEPVIKAEPDMYGYYFLTDPEISTTIKQESSEQFAFHTPFTLKTEPMIDTLGIKVEPDNAYPGEQPDEFCSSESNTMTEGCVEVKAEMEENFCHCPEDHPCCEEPMLHGPEAPHDIVSGDTATDGTATDGTATDGTATYGTATDGTATDVTATDGTATDGTATCGTAKDGTATDGTATYGSASSDDIASDDASDGIIASDDSASDDTNNNCTSTDSTTTNDTAIEDTVTIDTAIGDAGNIVFYEVTDDITDNDINIYDTATNEIEPLASDEVTDDIVNNYTDTIDDTNDTAASDTATTVSLKIPPVPGDFEDTMPYGWPSDPPENIQVPKILLKIPKKKKYTKKLFIVKGCDRCKYRVEDADLGIDDAEADDLPDNPFIHVTCPICGFFFFSLDIFKMHYLEHCHREDHPEFNGHRERLNVCKLCCSITVLGKVSKNRKPEGPKDTQKNRSIQTDGDHSEINKNTEDLEDVPELKKSKIDITKAGQEDYTTEVVQDKHVSGRQPVCVFQY